MANKNVLILGAGFLQKPAILAAKELGYTVTVVDANEAAVAIPFADCFEHVDLKDRDGILAVAENLEKNGGLDGIFTAGTDFSASVSYAGEKLGKHCHSFEAALNASGKTRMRACFSAADVPSPQFCRISENVPSDEELSAMIQGLGLPCVIKPADNMGARGCRMIRSVSESHEAVANALENSRTRTAVIEQFMDGPEYSIDALVYDGTMTITGFADRHIYFPPYFIETGHTMPTEISDTKRLELIQTFACGVKSLGLTCGAAKADIKYTANGPMVGEIAARLSGGYMSGWTYPYASGCQLTREALLIACGRKPEYLESHRMPLSVDAPYKMYDVPCGEVCAERAYISIPGIVRTISGYEAARAVRFVKDVFPRAGENSRVDFPRNNVEKCGNVIALAPTRAEAASAAERAASCITLRLIPHNPETEAFLAGISAPGEEGFPPSAYRAESAALHMLSGIIPENVKVASRIPSPLVHLADSAEKDWNYCIFRETLRRFDELCPRHPALDARRFWTAAVRGGIQGALYVSDSANSDGVQQ